jgi:hypothetical protein
VVRRSWFRRLVITGLFGVAWLVAVAEAPASATTSSAAVSADGSGCC